MSILPSSSQIANALISVQLLVCVLAVPRSHGHESQPSPARLRSVFNLNIRYISYQQSASGSQQVNRYFSPLTATITSSYQR